MTELKFPKPIRVPRPKKALRSRRHTKTRVNKSGHEFLYGLQAHLRRRIEIFQRAGGKVGFETDEAGNILPDTVYTEVPANCQVCAETHPLAWKRGEGLTRGDWIHTESRHCDCLTCGLYGCRVGHIALHHGRSF